MQDLIDDKREGQSECISAQEKLVKSLVEAVVDSKVLNKKMTELAKTVDAHDRKHTEAIDNLRQFVTAQNAALLGRSDEIRESIKDISIKLDPLIKREEKVKLFILKWAVPTIILLLFVIFMGDKVKVLLEVLKAVK
jgi:hypothetical protein